MPEKFSGDFFTGAECDIWHKHKKHRDAQANTPKTLNFLLQAINRVKRICRRMYHLRKVRIKNEYGKQ